MLAQLGPRVEFQLIAILLRRNFDEGRQDWQLSSDLTAYIEVHRTVEFFVGTSLLYNNSSDVLFTHLKPTGYAGARATFSLF